MSRFCRNLDHCSKIVENINMGLYMFSRLRTSIPDQGLETHTGWFAACNMKPRLILLIDLCHGKQPYVFTGIHSAGWLMLYRPANAILCKFSSLNAIHPREEVAENSWQDCRIIFWFWKTVLNPPPWICFCHQAGVRVRAVPAPAPVSRLAPVDRAPGELPV